MELNDILFATDFAKSAEQAQAAALSMATAFDARIHFFHALEFPLPVFEPYTVVAPRLFLSESRKGAREKLDAALASAKERGLAGTALLGEVPAPAAIAARAEEVGADLIVVGSEGHTGLQHLLLGSVAERTVEHAPCSVLAARDPLDGSGPVVVGTDFSRPAGEAVREACEIADRLGADLHIVHAATIVTPIVVPFEAAFSCDFHDHIQRNAEAQVAEVAKSCRIAGAATTEVSTAPPQVALNQAAERLGARLIVVGSRGLTGVKHLLLGSVAERTVRHATRSVWTVRPRTP